jgi:hypothetical protein
VAVSSSTYGHDAKDPVAHFPGLSSGSLLAVDSWITSADVRHPVASAGRRRAVDSADIRVAHLDEVLVANSGGRRCAKTAKKAGDDTPAEKPEGRGESEGKGHEKHWGPPPGFGPCDFGGW